MEVDAEGLLGVCFEGHGADRLARFRATQMHDVPTRLLAKKVVIETHHAVHVGPRQVELGGDDGDGVLRHITHCLLNAMQDRHQCTIE